MPIFSLCPDPKGSRKNLSIPFYFPTKKMILVLFQPSCPLGLGKGRCAVNAVFIRCPGPKGCGCRFFRFAPTLKGAEKILAFHFIFRLKRWFKKIVLVKKSNYADFIRFPVPQETKKKTNQSAALKPLFRRIVRKALRFIRGTRCRVCGRFLADENQTKNLYLKSVFSFGSFSLDKQRKSKIH